MDSPTICHPQQDGWLILSVGCPFRILDTEPSRNSQYASSKPVAFETEMGHSNSSTTALVMTSWAILSSHYSGSTAVNMAVQVSMPARTMALAVERAIRVEVPMDREVQDLLHAFAAEIDQIDTSPGTEEPAHKDSQQHISIIIPRGASLVGGGLQTETKLIAGTSLTLRIQQDQASQWVCWADYDATAYSLAQTARIVHTFVHLTEQLNAGTGKCTIQQLDFVSSLDRDTVNEWNADPAAPISTCLHELVAAHAKVTPAAEAVSAWDGSLSYQQLDRLSSQIASHLHAAGIPKGQIVPLLFEKSKWMVVSILAVHKVGGVCACLPASHPEYLLHTIFEETGTDWILASQTQADRLQPYRARLIPAAVHTSFVQTSAELHTRADPEDTGFVIFTSGSTGKPKGVLLPHRAHATSVNYHGNMVNVRSTSRVLQFSSYAFDMSVIETWHALSRGACLCIPSEDQRLWHLPRFLREHRVSWAFFTPTMLRSYEPADFPPLDSICLGGENVPYDLVRQWHNHARLFNFWGPAESTGGAACEILAEKWIPGTFGLGAGCILWIARSDDVHQLAAVGAVGEVLVEGAVVGQGYLHDPGRTNEVFIPPPRWRAQFAIPLQGTFYKTGDLAQYNADGTVRYVSRKDTVVKINGQRVDTDAVECTIRSLPSKLNVAVDAIPLRAGLRSDPVLIAFIETPNGSDRIFQGSIRDPVACAACASFLQEQLGGLMPRFMVPRFFIPLTTLPIGSTGKIDKKRLREALRQASHADILAWLGAVATPPRRSQTGPEALLVASISEVLGLPEADIDLASSFRAIGGDSVSAIWLVRTLGKQGQALHVEPFLQGTQSLAEMATSMRPASQAPSAKSPEPFSLLSANDRKPLALLREEIAAQCQIAPAAIEDVYPCTPLQQGLLAISEGFDCSAYVDRFLFRLPRTIDIDRIQRAWDVVVQAMAILRTRITHTLDGQWYQVVGGPLEWTVYPSVDGFINTDRARPLGVGTPLCRLSVIGAEPTTLGMTIHHAIYDAWTLSLVLRLVEAAYHGAAPSSFPFSPFVRHLQDYQQQQREEMALFWRRELVDVQPVTFPEYPTANYSPRLTTSVRASAVRPPGFGARAVSPTVQMRLAWALLLALYSDTEDVVYGSVVDGRRASLPGIENLAGPTIATVPVRTIVSRQSTVREALVQVQSRMEAMVPFEQSGLRAIAGLGHDMALACRFHSLLVVQSDPQEFHSPVLGQAEARLNGVKGFPGYALVLLCYPSYDSWKLELQADDGLVSKAQAVRMLHQLVHLLGQLHQDDRPLAQLDLLCPEDRNQLAQWHRSAPQQMDCCIQDLVTAQCKAAPTRVAVSAWDGDFTYADLDRASSRLAWYLHLNGVGRGDILPILCERSRWVPLAMLAVLKTGAAFVLLDADEQHERVREICDLVGATQLVIAASGHGSVSAVQAMTDDAHIVGPSTMASWPAAEEADLEACHASPNDVAYVVFTSGSTGNRKGILIEHRSSSSAIIAQRDRLRIAAQSRVLQLSSYTFDSFAVEILTTLCAGGCVCVPSPAQSQGDIAGAIRAFAITWLVITPSMLRLLPVGDVPTLETVVVVGETMLPAQAEEWAGQVQLICGYGPSECCTGASAQLIEAKGIDVRQIGAGMGCLLWLVHKDDHHALVPVGTVGEVVIQGPIVGREYLHRPIQTTAAFLDTADWVPGLSPAAQRLYKTGDLARYNRDGTCTFLGRKGRLTKLRGQRVNVAEVEMFLQKTLQTTCHVSAAVISPPDDPPVLVAFIHYPSDDLPSTDLFRPHSSRFAQWALGARQALERALPAVMVPSLYLQVSQLPLTSSGKVNQRALEQAASSLTASELHIMGSLAGPEGDPLDSQDTVAQQLSRFLAEIVSKKLHQVESTAAIVGHNVSPVRIGLDSIDIIIFSRLIARHFKVTIPTPVLLRTSLTVRDVADMIRQEGASEGAAAPQTKDGTPENLAAWWQDYQRRALQVNSLPIPANIKTLCVDEAHHRPRRQRIFLTGGTGFLGAHILHQLVVRPDVEAVTVLVRAPTAAAAMARIVDSARLALWWREEYRPVITPWTGDLCQERLGLSEDQWAKLCAAHFNAIIHNGANVHWVYDYSTLAPANVGSTLQLLSAVAACPPSMRFTYISALMPDHPGLPDPAIVPPCLNDGYSQTKYVSELLIHHFVQTQQNRGIAIIRPGLMMGRMEDGIAHPDDVLWRVVSVAMSAGAYNASEIDSWLYICPVDWVAAVVIQETLQRSSPGRIALTAIQEGLPVPDFWQAICLASEQSLAPIEAKQWLSLIQEKVESAGASSPLWPVLDFLTAAGGQVGYPRKDFQRQAATLESMIRIAVVRNAQYLSALPHRNAAKQIFTRAHKATFKPVVV